MLRRYGFVPPRSLGSAAVQSADTHSLTPDYRSERESVHGGL